MSNYPHPDDTIAALASAPGAALRGIVRVSGARAFETVAELLWPGDPPIEAKTAACMPRRLRVDGLSIPLPADVCFWPGRRSYTRQPLAELHLPGSPPILEAVLGSLHARGVRAAQPGEFTLRAFLAGRVDLLQAEAVLGVIDAADPQGLARALAQLGGGVSSQMVQLRGDLLDLLADLEAGLDFADEPIEFVSHSTLVGRLGLARDALASLVARSASRWRSSDRPVVVLAGPPNAGKSSLFNALVGTHAALVSEIRGTTRDYLQVEIDVENLPITLVDTAGDEPATTGVPGRAQSQRQEAIERADLVVWCFPADADERNRARPDGPRSLSIVTKADLLTEPSQALSVSTLRRTGLDQLRTQIVSRLTVQQPDEAGLLGTSAARCRDSLLGAIAALDRAVDIARHEADQELLAIEVRESLEELGKVVGAVYTDDILNRIFSRFCIGK